jgi:hypothetical protein
MQPRWLRRWKFGAWSPYLLGALRAVYASIDGATDRRLARHPSDAGSCRHAATIYRRLELGARPEADAGELRSGMKTERQEGTIKSWISHRGFGFLTTDDHREFFSPHAVGGRR